MTNRVIFDAITSPATSNIEGMGSYGFEPTIHFVITGTASVDVEASNNGVDFETIATITASGMYYFNRAPAMVRLDATSIASGAVSAILDGVISHI